MLLSAERASRGEVRVYRGATLADGTAADVAIEGRRIVGIRRPGDADALDLPHGAVEVDAAGLLLAPGEIAVGDVRDDEAARRGITTIADPVPLSAHASSDTVVNVAPLASSDELRTGAGVPAGASPTAAQLAEMRRLLGEALDAGAFGLASVIDEQADAALEALCRILAERGGCWVVQRDRDLAVPRDVSPALRAIAERAGCRLVIPSPGAGEGAAAELAELLGLDRDDAPRGVMREGACADLVVRRPAAASDAEPTVVEVLVDGVPVIASGESTGARPGRVLRRPPVPHRASVPLVDHEIDPDGPAHVLRLDSSIGAEPGLEGVARILQQRLGTIGASDDAGRIRLRIDGALPAEGFRITVTAEAVDIAGGTAEGVFRGAMTFRQLCDPEQPAGTPIPAGVWTGAPALGWRGVMLDVARHFSPIADLRRLIDLLADHHLNVLHLHLTDDQGWRFEVPGMPRLTEIGAVRSATQLGHGPDATIEPGRHEGFYTLDELRELDAYAAERFVTLVPEVELPGHVQAALAAYPELGNLDVTEPAAEAWPSFGVNRRTLAPTDEALAFGFAAIDALCDAFASPWIGIGGDEVAVDEWAASPAAQQRMRELGFASAREVQPWFTRAFVAHVCARGRTALAWDEVLEGDVPDGVRLLAWRGPVAMREALRRGIPVIACPDLEAYLDYPQADDADEPIRVGPPLPIEKSYTLHVPDGAQGGQANVWTEHLPTRDRVDFAMFPRLSALAERLWQGGAPPPFEGFAARLPVQLRRLRAAGVQYRPLDGPLPAQRRPGVPGKPMSVAQREAIVAGLVAGLTEAGADERRRVG